MLDQTMLAANELLLLMDSAREKCSSFLNLEVFL